MRETWVWSLGWEDPLEKRKAIQSSILAWRIPWTLQWMGSQGVGHDWVTFIFTFFQETCSWRSQSSKQNTEGQEIKWFDCRWADIRLFVEAVKKQHLPGTWINSLSLAPGWLGEPDLRCKWAVTEDSGHGVLLMLHFKLPFVKISTGSRSRWLLYMCHLSVKLHFWQTIPRWC